MATTTNYSWTTPDDTALVKDGAAAIRTLGSSIDTTTKALNPSTTLGDIEYRSSTANTNTRLGVGTTGQVLTVAGGVPSWATASSGSMTQLATGSLSGSSITISSISGSYQHLQLVLRDVTCTFAGGANILMRFNSDTGNNYLTKDTSLSGSSDTFGESYNYAVGVCHSTSNTLARVDIPDYANTDTMKLSQVLSIAQVDATNYALRNVRGAWNNTAAISSITLFAAGGDFAGSYYLYGVK